MKDIHNQLRVRNVLGPVTLSADNVPANIDSQGFDAAMYSVGVGIGGITFSPTNKIEIKMLHGDTDVPAEHVAVTGDDVDILLPDGTKGVVGAGGIVRELIAAHAAATVTKVGYVGNKRYRSFLADFSGTHGAGTPLHVEEVLGHPNHAPVGV